MNPLQYDYDRLPSELELECLYGKIPEIRIGRIPADLMAKIPSGDSVFSVPDMDFPGGLRFRMNRTDMTAITLNGEFESCWAVCRLLKTKCFFLPVLFPDLILKMRVRCTDNTDTGGLVKDRKIRESLLSIDIGNSRTGAVLCPDIHSDKFELIPLKPRSHCMGAETDEGVWDSCCVFAKSTTYRQSTPSFVRTGSDARFYLELLRETDGRERFFVRSPKRYFWNTDARDMQCLLPVENKAEWYFSNLQEELAEGMSLEAGKSRALFLAGAVYELLEQAERFLNGRGPDVHCVTKLVVTYPADWTVCERDGYGKMIWLGATHYVEQRCPPLPLELTMNCNETMALLASYVTSEYWKNTGSLEFWLMNTGSTPGPEIDGTSSKFRLRAGVIDLGGGSCHLAVADLSLSECGVRMSSVYNDGTNESGDELLRQIVRDILLPKVLELFGADRIPAFTACLKKNPPKAEPLTRSFWHPLALAFLTAAEEADAGGLNTFAIPVSGERMNPLFALGALLKELGCEPDSLPDAVYYSGLELKFNRRDRMAYHARIAETFAMSPLLFGAMLRKLHCSLVLWGGKLADTASVRNAFRKFIALPEDAFLLLSEYRTARQFPLKMRSGIIADTKLAAVSGAAVAAMSEYGFPLCGGEIEFDFESDVFSEKAPVWGVNRNGLAFQRTLDENGCVRFDFFGSPVLLRRKKFNHILCCPCPGYEFRIRTDSGVTFERTDRIRVILLSADPDGLLTFRLGPGHYHRNGELVPEGKADDFELRLRTLDAKNATFDTGTIFEGANE